MDEKQNVTPSQDEKGKDSQSLVVLLKNFEDGVSAALGNIIARLQELIQAKDIDKDLLLQEESKLISLAQVSLITKALSVLLLPKGDRGTKSKELLLEIKQLEEQLKDKINIQNIEEQDKNFYEQLTQTERSILEKEQAMRQKVAQREQEIATSIQRTFQNVSQAMNKH